MSIAISKGRAVEIQSTLEHFAVAPSNELDSTMSSRISTLIGKEPREIVKGILDVLQESISFGLASDVAINCLETFARQLCEANGLEFDRLQRESEDRAPTLAVPYNISCNSRD